MCHLVASCVVGGDFCQDVRAVEKGLSNPAVVLATRWSDAFIGCKLKQTAFVLVWSSKKQIRFDLF